MERLESLLDDREVLTIENGRYVNEIREVIMTLISINVSMNSVNHVIRVVLKKLAGLESGRLPSAEVRHRLLVEAKYLANVQVGQAMLESSDVESVIVNTLHGDGTSKLHRHFQNFQITTTKGASLNLGLLEMGRSDTTETMNTFETNLYEVSEILCSLEGDSSLESKGKKVAELVSSLKNTQSDQGPVNPLFNKELASFTERLLPQFLENWDALLDDAKKDIALMGNFY